MIIPTSFEYAYWAVALIVSLFLGFGCFSVHGANKEGSDWVWRAGQVWLNFVGAFVGWIALWFLARQWWGVWQVPSDPAKSVQLTLSDIGLALTAFIGITGYLPMTMNPNDQVLPRAPLQTRESDSGLAEDTKLSSEQI